MVKIVCQFTTCFIEYTCFDYCWCAFMTDNERRVLLKSEFVLAAQWRTVSVSDHLFCLMPICFADCWRFRSMTDFNKGSLSSFAEWWIFIAKWQDMVHSISRPFKTALRIGQKRLQTGLLSWHMSHSQINFMFYYITREISLQKKT